MDHALPEGIQKASMQNSNVMQVTQDIELAIAEMERGDTVTMAEFRKMFARWKDIK